MQKKYWQNYFADEILERGLNYFEEKYILDIDYSDDKITALVDGSKTYTVTINFEDEEITRMDCTCPHAYKGNNCKHMACVLYSIEKE
ncbi:MAG: hypothetical protein E7Z84_07970 [Methanosphaera stadtmanae]|nr:hypothetical protein [Methanosphaera stadtmanae]